MVSDLTCCVSGTAVIPFHGVELRCVRDGQTTRVALRPICEALGLNWAAQQQKLVQDERFNYMVIHMVAPDGKTRDTATLPADEISAWLFGVSVNRVAPSARPLLLAFQRETVTAIHDYWSGQQTAPRNTSPAPSVTTVMRGILDEIDSLHETVQAMNGHLGQVMHTQNELLQDYMSLQEENEALREKLEHHLATRPINGSEVGEIHRLGVQLGRLVGYRRAWGMFKAHFRIAAYRDLPAARYEEAVHWLEKAIQLNVPRFPTSPKGPQA